MKKKIILVCKKNHIKSKKSCVNKLIIFIYKKKKKNEWFFLKNKTKIKIKKII